MTSEQEARYRELKRLLKEAMPILKHLRFTLPQYPSTVLRERSEAAGSGGARLALWLRECRREYLYSLALLW
jgi:hypothetical protein